MILKDIGIDYLTQGEIAEHFGVCVPINYTGNVQKINHSDDNNSLGITIKDNEINDFFKKYNIGLVEKYVPINSINDWQLGDYINSQLASKSYIICGYDYSYLYHLKEKEIGHVSLILNAADDIITLLDPGPKDAGIKNVSIDELYLAIRSKKNGLWIISKK